MSQRRRLLNQIIFWVLCLLALAGVVTPLWMLVFGRLWLLQNLVYTYTAYRTSHAVL